jgi:hypothetical protein
MVKDLRREQQFRSEGVEQCLPFPARRMHPEVTGILIADHEVAEFVGSGSTTTPRITPKAHNRYCDIAVDHR